MAHIVKLLDDLEFRTPAEFDGRSKGYAADAVVNEPGGGVQMGFRVSRLDAGGAVEAHVQSFEESIYVMEGSLVARHASRDPPRWWRATTRWSPWA